MTIDSCNSLAPASTNTPNLPENNHAQACRRIHNAKDTSTLQNLSEEIDRADYFDETEKRDLRTTIRTRRKELVHAEASERLRRKRACDAKKHHLEHTSVSTLGSSAKAEAQRAIDCYDIEFKAASRTNMNPESKLATIPARTLTTWASLTSEAEMLAYFEKKGATKEQAKTALGCVKTMLISKGAKETVTMARRRLKQFKNQLNKLKENPLQIETNPSMVARFRDQGFDIEPLEKAIKNKNKAEIKKQTAILVSKSEENIDEVSAYINNDHRMTASVGTFRRMPQLAREYYMKFNVRGGDFDNILNGQGIKNGAVKLSKDKFVPSVLQRAIQEADEANRNGALLKSLFQAAFSGGIPSINPVSGTEVAVEAGETLPEIAFEALLKIGDLENIQTFSIIGAHSFNATTNASEHKAMMMAVFVGKKVLDFGVSKLPPTAKIVYGKTMALAEVLLAMKDVLPDNPFESATVVEKLVGLGISTAKLGQLKKIYLESTR